MSGVLIHVIVCIVNVAVGVMTNGEWKTAGNSIVHIYWNVLTPAARLSKPQSPTLGLCRF